jgi:hypothetical protein
MKFCKLWSILQFALKEEAPSRKKRGAESAEKREEEGMTEKGVQELRERAASPENSPGVITNEDVHATDVTMAENVEEEQEEETSSSGT